MEEPLSQPAVVSPLEAHLGDWLRFVSNHGSHAFSRAEPAAGAHRRV